MFDKEVANKVILWTTTVVLLLFEVYSLTTNSHYKWDFIFLMLLLWGTFFLRERISLHPFHFGLFSLFLIIHNLGTFGTYELFLFGIEYDFYVHLFFGVVSSFILFRSYKKLGHYTGWVMIIAIIAAVLGFSAFHELFEYAGAKVMGEGEGVLFIGAGDVDEWDTQKDMRNNLFGALLGLGLYWLYGLWRSKSFTEVFGVEPP